jgi:hypothetical protein
MKTVIVSYSLTGNNEHLAASLSTLLEADRVRITESKSRTMSTIVTDMMLNRTPKVAVPVAKVSEYDLVLFVGPVWMGQIATPFRACFKQLSQEIGDYAFISINGGADGPNPKLAGELEKRLGRAPLCLVDLHVADFLPPEPKPTRRDTMAYRISEEETRRLTGTVFATLNRAGIIG